MTLNWLTYPEAVRAIVMGVSDAVAHNNNYHIHFNRKLLFLFDKESGSKRFREYLDEINRLHREVAENYQKSASIIADWIADFAGVTVEGNSAYIAQVRKYIFACNRETGMQNRIQLQSSVSIWKLLCFMQSFTLITMMICLIDL